MVTWLWSQQLIVICHLGHRLYISDAGPVFLSSPQGTMSISPSAVLCYWRGASSATAGGNAMSAAAIVVGEKPLLACAES